MSKSGRPLKAALRVGMVVAMAVVSAPFGAFAYADDPTTTGAEAPRDTTAPPVVVTGYVDTYYQYNFNRVPPSLRSFDVEHNAFSLSLADVALSKAVTPESRVGFRTELGFGKTADLIASYEPASDGKEVTKHVLQAYASVLAGSKLQTAARISGRSERPARRGAPYRRRRCHADSRHGCHTA